jgi:hypothetical protein
MGIFGLFDSKKGPKTHHNKTSDNVASKVVETADYHPELDAQEISKVFECSSGHKPSVSTAQRILRSKGMNPPKGRRSKKTMEILGICSRHCCGLYARKVLVIVHI